MKKYKSKKEIYKDYALAVKFVLRVGPRKQYFEQRNYARFEAALIAELNAKIVQFENSIENFDTPYPLSKGFTVEFPVTDASGGLIGMRCIVLKHESGPEIFLQLSEILRDPAVLIATGWLAGKAGWLVGKVLEKVVGKTVDAGWKKLAGFIQTKWQQLYPDEPQIAFVEFRTEHKGVARIPFAQFEPDQLACLVRKLPKLKHLLDANESCFDGRLLAAPSATVGTAPQAYDVLETG